jgi:hypothetical protein
MQTKKFDWIDPLPRKAADPGHPLHHIHLARAHAGFGLGQHEKVEVDFNDDGTSEVRFYDSHNDMDGHQNGHGRRVVAVDLGVTDPDE